MNSVSHTPQSITAGTRRFAHGVLWSTSGTVVQGLSQLAVLVVLGRLLTPAEFGVATAATLVAQLSLVFAELGVAPAVVQRPQLDSRDIRVAFTLTCLLGVGVGTLLVATAPSLAVWFGSPELAGALRVYALVFLLRGASSVAEALLQRELRFRELAGIDSASFLLGYSLTACVLALAGFSFWALIMAYVAQAGVKSVLLLFSVRHAKVPLLDGSCIRQFVHFGIGQTLSRLSSYAASQADSFVLAGAGVGTRLGEYGRAQQLAVMPGNQIGQVFDRVLFPTLAGIQENTERFRTGYARSLTAISMLALPASLLLIVLAPHIVPLVLGSGWHGVILPFQFLAGGLVFRLLHKVSDPTARAKGAVYERAWRQAAYALLVFCGATLALPHGLGALAAVAAAASAADATLMVGLCARLSGMRAGQILRALLPGARLAAVVIGVYLAVEFLAQSVTLGPKFTAFLALLLAGLLVSALLLLAPRAVLGAEGSATVLAVTRASPRMSQTQWVRRLAGADALHGTQP